LKILYKYGVLRTPTGLPTIRFKEPENKVLCTYFDAVIPQISWFKLTYLMEIDLHNYRVIQSTLYTTDHIYIWWGTTMPILHHGTVQPSCTIGRYFDLLVYNRLRECALGLLRLSWNAYPLETVGGCIFVPAPRSKQ
jgi:hypothetical protein